MSASSVTVRWLGQQDYLTCWRRMQDFTQQRLDTTEDEIWLLEHFPVFTQGQNGKPEHVLRQGDIPLIQTDRGGQVTYHGPGQLMVYFLVDLKRKKLTVREFVTHLEQSIVDLLAAFQIVGTSRREAPGVYVADKKICSIGLRVRRGSTYHGMAFNVALDLTPFTRIHPCGYATLKMTQFSELGGLSCTKATGHELIAYLMNQLSYTSTQFTSSE
ncbi:MAG: octanoyltransferase [Gammaproteobacteria bacterium RIFCSPHIGHO2_12_FULL_45_12]|nr:MAG: octanoyltransferase [Gammaproteobacteria bacterium RIFCSPHIGHO2_12_FULL_45_12]